MAYATTAQLRVYLPQVAAGAGIDAMLQAVLDRAYDIVNLALGFTFAAAGIAAAKDVMAQGGRYLELPAHTLGSVTVVAEVDSKGTLSESTIDLVGYWDELEDGRLYKDDGWEPGEWYRVTAPWGYGVAPAAIVEVELELAVNLWRSKDRGMFSDVIGTEGGGAVGYSRALTNQQRMIIDAVRARTLGVVIA